jgi:hypothetical protein
MEETTVTTRKEVKVPRLITDPREYQVPLGAWSKTWKTVADPVLRLTYDFGEPQYSQIAADLRRELR